MILAQLWINHRNYNRQEIHDRCQVDKYNFAIKSGYMSPQFHTLLFEVENG